MQLLERDTHLQHLHELAARAASGSGCIALVSGEAGIGKTSLVDAFARGLHGTHSLQVLRGACDDLFTPRPLGPLLDIAAEHPDLPIAHTDRDALFAGLLDTLRHRATVLIIEDLHWGDEATLDVLCYAGRRITSTRALLVLTFRDDELDATHPLRRTLADFPRAATHRLPLPRLSERAVQQMARSAHRSEVGLYAATSGNPFYVTEALASDTHEIPVSVRDAVLARARRLGSTPRQLLDLISIVPGRTEIWLLDALAANSTNAAAAAHDAGVLQELAGSVAFRHELARRAWEDSVSPAARRSLHQRVLGALLERDEVDPARVVHHAARAGDGGVVLRYGHVAAETAVRVGAHLQAAELYGVTVPYIGALEPAEQARILEAYARELQIVGRVQDGLQAMANALAIWRELGDQLREGNALRQLAQLNWYQGNLAEAVRLASEAVAVLEPLGATPEVAMAYSARSQLHMCIEDHDTAIQIGELAIARGRDLGRDDVVMHSLNNVGTSRLYRGEEAGLAMLEESLRMALAAGRHLDAGRALINIAEALSCLRQFERAKPYEERAIAFCSDHDIDAYMLCVLGDRSQVHLALSDWNRATDDAQAVLAHPRCPPVDRIPALAALARIRARRGDPDVEAALDEALAIARPTGEVLRLWPVVASRLEAAWLHQTQPDKRAQEVVLAQRVIQMAQHVRNRWALGEVAFWTQMLGVDVPVDAEAAEPFRLALKGEYIDAANAFAGYGLEYDRAVMLTLSGEEPAMRAGFEALRDLGARATAERLLRELRARGTARIPRGPSPATRSNPVLLTKKQAAVLELMVAGLSNNEIADRLFISSKTTAHHVSAVLSKLDARSRAEAAARARELGLVRSN
jgi:DNA-binding CsgD family transcriptional regulator/tetratricopeptide (TPR) repeat protein